MQENKREKSPIKERILQYLEIKGITRYSFYKETGISRGTLDQHTGISEDNLMRFFAYAQDISPIWLLRGEGNIFISKGAESVTNSNSDQKGNEMGNFPKVQKKLPSEPQMPTVIVVDTENFDLVPIVDVSAAAGGCGAFNQDYIDQEDVMKLPPGMLKRGYHLCIRVKGMSMEPTIPDGSHVIVRLLDRSEWSSVRSDDVYVVTDRIEGATFIKRLQNRLRERGCLVCTSDNPDKFAYRDFEVPEDDISNIWHVEYCISSKLPNVLVEYESQMDQVDARFNNMESRFDQVSQRFDQVAHNLETMRKLLAMPKKSL